MLQWLITMALMLYNMQLYAVIQGKFTVALKNLLRACLHEGGGPQAGEVTRLGGVTRLSIKSLILM